MRAGLYNRLATAGKAFKNALTQIEVQLQHRLDLRPSLVHAAKG